MLASGRDMCIYNQRASLKKKKKCGQDTDTTNALTILYMYGVEIMVRIKLLN